MVITCQNMRLPRGSFLSICKVYCFISFKMILIWCFVPVLGVINAFNSTFRAGEAEANLERLHQCAEKELNNYLNDGTSDEFTAFRTKLAGLTW